MGYEEELKAIPAELSEISGTADDQFDLILELLNQTNWCTKAPLVIVSDLRVIADFIERIY